MDQITFSNSISAPSEVPLRKKSSFMSRMSKSSEPKPAKVKKTPIPFTSGTPLKPSALGYLPKVRAPLGSTPLYNSLHQGGPSVILTASSIASSLYGGERREGEESIGDLPMQDPHPDSVDRPVNSPLAEHRRLNPSLQAPSPGRAQESHTPTFSVNFSPQSSPGRRSLSGEPIKKGGASRRDSGNWADAWSTTNGPANPRIKKSQEISLIDDEVSSPEARLAFDSATSDLAAILELSLVYLVAINLSKPPVASSFTIISSTFSSGPAPTLDPQLHLLALRSPERGLVYQRSAAGIAKKGFRAGILVPVLEREDLGYVLCSFTSDPERQFDDRDVRFMRSIASELEVWMG